MTMSSRSITSLHLAWSQLSLVACTLLATGCANDDSVIVEARAQAIVYGQDGRRELYVLGNTPSDTTDDALRTSARAVAAIIPSIRISAGEVSSPSVAEREQVCEDERFSEQPAAATCSAVLIADDLVLTAGHCVRDAADCQSQSFVFDYAYKSAEGGLLPLQVYACRALLVRADEPLPHTPWRDYAIIALTEPVVDRAPVMVRSRALSDDEALHVISATGGAPLKIASDSRVLDPRTAQSDYFTLQSDAFVGSSGGPVFDRQGLLAGVLVRGGDDYVWDEAAGCRRVAFASPGSAEHAGYVRQATDALCAQDNTAADVRLCGAKPSNANSGCSVMSPSAHDTLMGWLTCALACALGVRAFTRSRRGAPRSTR